MKIPTKKDIYSYFGNLYKKAKESSDQQKAEEKAQIIEYITRDWTEKQVHDYNCQVIANSAGWLGGNYKEKDIKQYFLSHNEGMFSKEEYEELSDMIKGISKNK